MYGPFQIEGFAIASADGMLANSSGLMPNSLKLEADQQLITAAFARADVLIHGRRSHEGQPNSHARRRLIMTHKVSGLAPVEGDERSRYWNPAGASSRRRAPRSAAKEACWQSSAEPTSTSTSSRSVMTPSSSAAPSR